VVDVEGSKNARFARFGSSRVLKPLFESPPHATDSRFTI
jgi:hypothetical protein